MFFHQGIDFFFDHKIYFCAIQKVENPSGHIILPQGRIIFFLRLDGHAFKMSSA